MNNLKEFLASKGIKATPVRLEIYKTMSDYDKTFSLTDLENDLLDIDKSTIFRTITLFLENNLIHKTEDGSGSMKYCICHNHGECKIDEFHCHFFCEICKQTFCLDNNPIPAIKLPEGYITNSINYVASGICPKCSARKQ